MKKSMYIFSSGEFKRKDNTLYFESGSFKRFIPIELVSDIYVFNEVSINTALLNFLSTNEIMVHYFNYYGYYSGTIYPRQHLSSGEIILRQVEHYLDEKKRRTIAEIIEDGAAKNMRRVLMYYQSRGIEISHTIDAISELINTLPSQASISQMMGVEGNIHEYYYKAFDEIIGERGFSFQKRTRRPPQNELNALISFGNSIIYTTVLSEIYKTHLDPRIGYLHTTNFRRFTLNLDIAEIFKPILVDRAILSLLDKKMITPKDFEKGTEGVSLNENGRKVFLQEIDTRLSSTINHRSIGREISYRRLIRMECYKLEKHLLGEQQYSPFVALW